MNKIKINNFLMDSVNIKEIELIHMFYYISKIIFLLNLIHIQEMNLEIYRTKKKITIGKKKFSS